MVADEPEGLRYAFAAPARDIGNFAREDENLLHVVSRIVTLFRAPESTTIRKMKRSAYGPVLPPLLRSGTTSTLWVPSIGSCMCLDAPG